MTSVAERPDAGSWRLAAWGSIVLLLSALAFVGNLTSEPPDDFIYQWSLGIGTIVQDGILLGIGLLLVRPWFADALAWRPPVSWRNALGLGAALLVGVYVLTAVLSPILQPGEEQGLVPSELDTGRLAPLVFNGILIVTFVPLVEELFFRGVGVWVLDRHGQWAAILGSGLAFALVHGLLEALPVFTAFGAALAWLRLWSRSIWPAIAVHATFNAIALAAALALAD